MTNPARGDELAKALKWLAQRGIERAFANPPLEDAAVLWHAVAALEPDEWAADKASALRKVMQAAIDRLPAAPLDAGTSMTFQTAANILYEMEAVDVADYAGTKRYSALVGEMFKRADLHMSPRGRTRTTAGVRKRLAEALLGMEQGSQQTRTTEPNAQKTKSPYDPMKLFEGLGSRHSVVGVSAILKPGPDKPDNLDLSMPRDLEISLGPEVVKLARRAIMRALDIDYFIVQADVLANVTLHCPQLVGNWHRLDSPIDLIAVALGFPVPGTLVSRDPSAPCLAQWITLSRDLRLLADALLGNPHREECRQVLWELDHAKPLSCTVLSELRAWAATLTAYDDDLIVSRVGENWKVELTAVQKMLHLRPCGMRFLACRWKVENNWLPDLTDWKRIEEYNAYYQGQPWRESDNNGEAWRDRQNLRNAVHAIQDFLARLLELSASFRRNHRYDVDTICDFLHDLYRGKHSFRETRHMHRLAEHIYRITTRYYSTEEMIVHVANMRMGSPCEHVVMQP